MIKVKLIQAHVLKALKRIPDNSIDCIVTSPPYWGLRRYPDSANTIWDGDTNCKHEWDFKRTKLTIGTDKNPESPWNRPFREEYNVKDSTGISGFCSKCGAWFGQLGLEPTLELYIKHLLQITKELKRVLKPSGVMFWNHGDSYIGSLQGYGLKKEPTIKPGYGFQLNKPYIPPKCMAMQSYRLILKMIDEQGWILRNIIIWYKPNHMPESVKDRFTKAYEPIFMLVKNRKYWFDLDAVRMPIKALSFERYLRQTKLPNPQKEIWESNNPKYWFHKVAQSFNYRVREAKKGHFGILGVKASKKEMEKYDKQGKLKWVNPQSELVEFMREKGSGGHYDYSGEILGKNPGDVWTIPTQPFPEAHFAVFPEELVRRCIKCGCPAQVCKKCGKPKKRIIQSLRNRKKELELAKTIDKKTKGKYKGDEFTLSTGYTHRDISPNGKIRGMYNLSVPIGWTDCGCNAGFEPGWVLDPFVGSGTTIKVAIEERRNAIGIEIVPEYIKMAMRRCNLPNPFVDFEFLKV